MSNILCGRAEELLKLIDNESIDLVITSPPYDEMRSYGTGCEFDLNIIIKELYRILKKGGVIVWVVSDQTVNGSETGTSFKQALAFMDCGFKLHDTMIFEKDNPLPVGGSNRYYQSFEFMFILSKGKPKTFNPLLVTRRNKYNDKRTHRYKSTQRGVDGTFEKKLIKINDVVKRKNVWKYTVSGGATATNKVAHKHPAIFPEKLVEDHILSWTNENDLILDPFGGSGTVGYVAKKLNRNFILIEKNINYIKDIIYERLKDE